MAKHFGRRADIAAWFLQPETSSTYTDSSVCVALKIGAGEYVLEPSAINPALRRAISRLGEIAVLSMASEITNSVIESILPEQKSVNIEHTGARIPVVSTLDDVSSYLVHSSRACIVRQDRLVLVWSDDTIAINKISNDVEKQLLGLVCSMYLSISGTNL